jgi:hypothetical protein
LQLLRYREYKVRPTFYRVTSDVSRTSKVIIALLSFSISLTTKTSTPTGVKKHHPPTSREEKTKEREKTILLVVEKSNNTKKEGKKNKALEARPSLQLEPLLACEHSFSAELSCRLHHDLFFRG